MQASVRRAGAFAAVATLVLATPALGAATAVPFALIAVIGRVVSDGVIFEVFARPGDRLEGELRGLVGFALAATGLVLLASLAGLPTSVLAAAVLLVGYGALAEQVVADRGGTEIPRAVAFAAGGALAGVAGQAAIGALAGVGIDPPTAIFLGATGGLVGALLRETFIEEEDPLVMVSVALLLWLFADLGVAVEATRIAVALAVTGAFGYASFRLETASVAGMLTGVLFGLWALVLGGYGWFAVLIAFFGVGGLATKYRYEEKRDRGVAEGNEGARGTRNVLGNAAVALAAVLGATASGRLPVGAGVFLFAFAGAVATAMSDTLSSEIGVLYDDPRLITTFEPVEPGTDGGVTVQGALAGVAGGAVVALITVATLDVGVAGGAVIVLAGAVGMVVDSLLGAAFEGGRIGNQTVNFLATLAGAVVAGGLGALA